MEAEREANGEGALTNGEKSAEESDVWGCGIGDDALSSHVFLEAVMIYVLILIVVISNASAYGVSDESSFCRVFLY